MEETNSVSYTTEIAASDFGFSKSLVYYPVLYWILCFILNIEYYIEVFVSTAL